jgi:hypothetical protein
MGRERMLKVVLVVVGLLFCGALGRCDPVPRTYQPRLAELRR